MDMFCINQSKFPLKDELEKHGYNLEDVTHVILTHLHFDHCGGNKHLTSACTICHEKELQVCACPQPFEMLGYSDLTFSSKVAEERAEKLNTALNPELDIFTPTGTGYG